MYVPEIVQAESPLSRWRRRFDAGSPTGPNYEAGGASAAPRDGLATISDLYDLFSF